MTTKLIITIEVLFYLCIFLLLGVEGFLYFSVGVLTGGGFILCIFLAYVYDALEKQ